VHHPPEIDQVVDGGERAEVAFEVRSHVAVEPERARVLVGQFDRGGRIAADADFPPPVGRARPRAGRSSTGVKVALLIAAVQLGVHYKSEHARFPADRVSGP